jgi:alanyl-tRNA synthetase
VGKDTVKTSYQRIEDWINTEHKHADWVLELPKSDIEELIKHARSHDETIALLYQVVGFTIGEMAVRHGVAIEIDQFMSTLQKKFDMPMYLAEPEEKRIVTL